MTWKRWMLAMVVLGATACGSPTGPRLPDPDGDDRPSDPNKPGVTALAQPVVPGPIAA